MRKLHAGLDVSLEMTSACVVDENGATVLETKALSDPEAIADGGEAKAARMPGAASARDHASPPFSMVRLTFDRQHAARHRAERRQKHDPMTGLEPIRA